MDLIQLARGRDQWGGNSCERDEPSGFVKGGVNS
jgi:hypothetical protein